MQLRNCAWEKKPGTPVKRIVWSRHGLHCEQCPKSIISNASYHFLDMFLAWKQFGADVWSLDAKVAQAILVLEDEWQKEKRYVETEKHKEQQ